MEHNTCSPKLTGGHLTTIRCYDKSPQSYLQLIFKVTMAAHVHVIAF